MHFIMQSSRLFPGHAPLLSYSGEGAFGTWPPTYICVSTGRFPPNSSRSPNFSWPAPTASLHLIMRSSRRFPGHAPYSLIPVRWAIPHVAPYLHMRFKGAVWDVTCDLLAVLFAGSGALTYYSGEKAKSLGVPALTNPARVPNPHIASRLTPLMTPA